MLGLLAPLALAFMPPSPVIPGVCQAFGFPCSTVAECSAIDAGCTHCVQRPGATQGVCQANDCNAPCLHNADGTPGQFAAADEPCDSCNTGACAACKACVGVKTGQCSACYAIDPTKGTACLYDDGHGCQRCWNPSPTPPGPGPAPRPPTPVDPACEICVLGACAPCLACVGKDTGSCASCWAVNETSGTACLYPDGHGCLKCWNKPAPTSTCSGSCPTCNSGVCSKGKCHAPCASNADCDDSCQVCNLAVCSQCQKEDKSCVPDELLGGAKPCCPGLKCVQDSENPDKMKCHKAGPAPPAPGPSPPSPPSDCKKKGAPCEKDHGACCSGLDCNSSGGKHKCE